MLLQVVENAKTKANEMKQKMTAKVRRRATLALVELLADRGASIAAATARRLLLFLFSTSQGPPNPASEQRERNRGDGGQTLSTGACDDGEKGADGGERQEERGLAGSARASDGAAADIAAAEVRPGGEGAGHARGVREAARRGETRKGELCTVKVLQLRLLEERNKKLEQAKSVRELELLLPAS